MKHFQQTGPWQSLGIAGFRTVRKRKDRRLTPAEFDVTSELLAAYRAYVASSSVEGEDWPEHWALHDLPEIGG